jgi:hypothetical protein
MSDQFETPVLTPEQIKRYLRNNELRQQQEPTTERHHASVVMRCILSLQDKVFELEDRILELEEKLKDDSIN